MSRPTDPPAGLPAEMVAYYQQGREAARLDSGAGLLERLRTQEIIGRYLPPPPATILDVGGGSGPYALWLARLGYAVHLIDAIPLHVEQALAASARQPGHPLASARVGDARSLDPPDASADAVLLLGPLYHLTEREDRLAALREARRMLRSERPGGVVVAAGISRAASALDGLFYRLRENPAMLAIIEQDLRDGQHRNPTAAPSLFTTAFFHTAGELEREISDAGLSLEALLPVEGPGWLLPDIAERMADDARRAELLTIVRLLEDDRTLIGMSAHLLAVARVPS